MAATAVHEQHDGAGAVKGMFIVGPAITINRCLDNARLIETFLKQKTTGIEFVIARAVAGTAGDQNNLFLFRPIGGPGYGAPSDEEPNRDFFHAEGVFATKRKGNKFEPDLKSTDFLGFPVDPATNSRCLTENLSGIGSTTICHSWDNRVQMGCPA
jgi:hypothetical protein